MEMRYKSGETFFFYYDCSSMASKVSYKSSQRKELKY